MPFPPLEPQRLLLPEHRGVPLGIGVIAIFVAAEFLQKADLARLVPADEGETVKALDGAVRHGAPESPLHHGLVPLVEILPDVPALYGAPGVPLVKPQLDLSAAVVLRPPALDIDGIRGEELLNARVLLVQPHGKPLPDLIFPLFLLFPYPYSPVVPLG